MNLILQVFEYLLEENKERKSFSLLLRKNGSELLDFRILFQTEDMSSFNSFFPRSFNLEEKWFLNIYTEFILYEH